MSAENIIKTIVLFACVYLFYLDMVPCWRGISEEKREKELSRLKGQIQVIVEQHQGSALLAQESIADFMESRNSKDFEVYCDERDPNSWIIIDRDMHTTGRAGEERVWDQRAKSRTILLLWNEKNDLKEWRKVYPKDASEG